MLVLRLTPDLVIVEKSTRPGMSSHVIWTFFLGPILQRLRQVVRVLLLLPPRVATNRYEACGALWFFV